MNDMEKTEAKFILTMIGVIKIAGLISLLPLEEAIKEVGEHGRRGGLEQHDIDLMEKMFRQLMEIETTIIKIADRTPHIREKMAGAGRN